MAIERDGNNENSVVVDLELKNRNRSFFVALASDSVSLLNSRSLTVIVLSSSACRRVSIECLDLPPMCLTLFLSYSPRLSSCSSRVVLYPHQASLEILEKSLPTRISAPESFFSAVCRPNISFTLVCTSFTFSEELTQSISSDIKFEDLTSSILQEVHKVDGIGQLGKCHRSERMAR